MNVEIGVPDEIGLGDRLGYYARIELATNTRAIIVALASLLRLTPESQPSLCKAASLSEAVGCTASPHK